MTRRHAGSPEERTQPHDLQAERSVLGAILLHGEVFDEVIDALVPGDFFRDAHRRIFEGMGRLADSKQAIDPVTLRVELSRTGELDLAGGPAYLGTLMDGVPRSSNVAHYAAIVAEKARLRATIRTANTLLAAAYDGEARASELAGDAAEKLYALDGGKTDGEAVLLADMVTPGIETLERAVARHAGSVTGLATGFAALDDLTTGLQPSDLVLVAARTSQGKTALALDFVRTVGALVPVLVFSLEMSRQQIFTRLLAAESGVDSHRLRSGYLFEADWPRIAGAMDRLAALRVLIADQGGIGVREVRSRARQTQAKHGRLGLVVVDYIQLMRGRGHFENRTQEIGTLSRGLKAIAKELDVPVVALAQLNRASEAAPGRKARRPQLSDLAESGSLENDADVVLLIYRPELKEDDAATVAEIIVAKQRNGPTGIVKLHWNAALVRFENIGQGA